MTVGHFRGYKFVCGTLMVVALMSCEEGEYTIPSTDVILNQSSGRTYSQGVYMPSSQFKGRCAAPRAGNSQDRSGTALDEKLWLRSFTNELYLWYSEVPDTNPGNFSVLDYFDLLKTPAQTPSGADKDRFHFTWDTAEYQAFSQSGAAAGYGMEFAVISNAPPRRAVVAYTEPGSPAAVANVQRGAELVTVDGVDFANGSNVDAINNALSPAAAGEAHTFVIRDAGSSVSRSVTLTSTIVTSSPVANYKTIGTVGYILFNDHITTAESQLITAVTALKAANITDLVLDIRYNGGGYLYIASQLAYMITSAAQTNGQTFERLQFNNKYTNVDPVTGQPLTPMPFLDRTDANQSNPTAPKLPTLNLSTVYVITGPGTCSASESIINGLRGIGVQVVQIGSTTCGKPYGFYPQDNCGTTYFTIEFKGVNAAGFGEYSDGFSPINTTTARGEPLPGCSVADDFSMPLGDPLEGRLAAALNYRNNSTCPTPSGAAPNDKFIQSMQSKSGNDGRIVTKLPIRENRIY